MTVVDVGDRSSTEAAGPEIVTIGGQLLEVQLIPAVGCRLHRLRAFGVDLLRTPASALAHTEDPYFWGGYVMAPWCNRISAIPSVVGGRTVDLPPGFPDGTAIHGQVATVPWTRRDADTFAVLGGGDGWPWPYEVTQRVTVAGLLLRLELVVTNRSDAPMPAGLGLHPWFVTPVDLAVSGRRVVTTNVAPASIAEAVAGQFDLRRRGPIPDDLDATWLDIGDPAVELAWPDLGLEASLRARSSSGLAVAVASPMGAAAVAVEPQTHAPWGLRRFVAGDPDGLVALPPGASLSLAIEIEVRRAI